MPFFNTTPGLVPLKIYSGSELLTTNINQLTLTGSGVTASLGQFNDLTLIINGGGGGGTGSTIDTSSFVTYNVYNPFTASMYAFTASYNTGSFSGSFTGSLLGTASYALIATTSSYPLWVSGSTLYSTYVPTNNFSPVESIFIGSGSGQSAGNANGAIYLGFESGFQSTNGSKGVYLGYRAGKGASNNYESILIGEEAGNDATDSYSSVFIGSRAGRLATNSEYGIFIGQEAGYVATNATDSTFIGTWAGHYAAKANNSVMIGPYVGELAVSASYSILLGHQAGYNLSTANSIGRNNIIIGTNVTLAKDRKDSINIGGLIFGTGSYFDSGFTGAFSGSSNGRIGINQPLPLYNLDVSGSGNFSNNLSASGSISFTGSLLMRGPSVFSGSVTVASGSNLHVVNGLISASYLSNNLSVGGTPGWTTGTRNTAMGILSQASITSTSDNTSLGYNSLLGGIQNTAVGSYAGRYISGTGNTSLGYTSLGNNTNALSYTIALGFSSMYNATGSGNNYNIGIGYESMYNITGGVDNHNIGIGYRTLSDVQNTYGNIGIGAEAGRKVTTGTHNTLIGRLAGFNIVTAGGNISIGYLSMYRNVSAGNNIVIGYDAGGSISGSTNNNIMIGSAAGGTNSSTNEMGLGNVGIGPEALLNISSSNATLNVAIGYQAGRGLTSGNSNILIGYRVGLDLQNGSSNVFIGYDSGRQARGTLSVAIGNNTLFSNASGSRNTAIGNGALYSAGSNSSAKGNGSRNTALGSDAGTGVISGESNIFIGEGSGILNSGINEGSGSYNIRMGGGGYLLDFGDYNIGIGYGSMGSPGSGNTVKRPGPHNVGLGTDTLSLMSSSVSTRNTALGSLSGKRVTSGYNNTFVGYSTGTNVLVGYNNILIGDSAGSALVDGYNNTVIGNFELPLTSSNGFLMIGAGSTERIRIDNLGTGSVSASLNISGSILYRANGTISSTLSATTQSVYGLNTSSYSSAFFDYSAISSSNIVAGTLIGTWDGSGGSINYVLLPTSSVGNTSGINFAMELSQSLAHLTVVTTTSGWNVKSIVRPL